MHIPIRAAVLAAATALVAACGSSSTNTGGPSGTVAPQTQKASIASEVPAAIRSKGTLVVAADATYAPDEFIASDGKTVVGMDADLAQALGQVLGLKMDVQNVTFNAILPGLQSGKYDLGMSSFTDTKQREQTVDFVTYFTAGTSFMIKTGGPAINTLDDLCGHTVAVESGTTEETDANGQKAKCASGKALTVQSYPDQNGVNNALVSGRADVAMADSPVAEYQVKQLNGQIQISGQGYGNAPYGIAIPKGNGMAQPILDALKQLMSSGAYQQVLAKWGLQSGAINNPQINGATS